MRLCLLLLLLGGAALAFLPVQPVAAQAPVSGAGVSVYTGTLTIPTYPCTTSTEFNATYNISYPKNQFCLPLPEPRPYTRLVLENDYLRLSILPELGGRVYELIFKPTGHNEFYRNPVIKPTPWGPPEQGGWLAAGGLEWGLPVAEHGYEWGTPWNYNIISNTLGITVTLRDSAPTGDRLRAEVAVHLPPDKALFYVTHRLENGRSIPLDFSYWTNAMLAPGPANAPTEHLRFVIPASRVTVHSRDPNDNFLPPAGDTLDWPTWAGRDMSRLGNWSGWFGFFAYPRSQADFTGVYDPSLDEGVMHIFPAAIVSGSKGFGFGWASPIDWHNWTDDGSGYVELHNGPQPTFWDTTHLEPGASLTYRDAWYPVTGLGSSLTTTTRFTATEEAVLAVTPTAAGFTAGLFSPVSSTNVQAVMYRLSNRSLLDERAFARLDPTTPQQWSVGAAGLTVDEISLMVFSGDGRLLAAINPLAPAPADTTPPTSQMLSLPSYVQTLAFTPRWSGQDDNSGIANFDIQVRDGVSAGWTDWLTRTTVTSATFTGQNGHTYFFRVRARDRAGNEQPFTAAEWGQTFTSVLVNPAPVLVTSRKLAGATWLIPGQSVTYTLAISNTGNLTAGLYLTDTLPPDLNLLTGTLAAGRAPLPTVAGREIRWQGALGPGESVRVTYQMQAPVVTGTRAVQTNTFWLDDGLNPPFSREQAVTLGLPAWLPCILKNR